MAAPINVKCARPTVSVVNRLIEKANWLAINREADGNPDFYPLTIKAAYVIGMVHDTCSSNANGWTPTARTWEPTPVHQPDSGSEHRPVLVRLPSLRPLSRQVLPARHSGAERRRSAVAQSLQLCPERSAASSRSDGPLGLEHTVRTCGRP